MQLVHQEDYAPQQHAFFPNSHAPLLALHQSARFLTFATRTHQIVLRNRATGRTTAIHTPKHPIVALLFTHEYLLAVEQTSHQIMAFSLKTEKLKTRLSGHRSQVTRLAYSRQNTLIASISHDVCQIYSEKSLSLIKTIKCSTSSFTDCCFGQLGGLFAASFKDGSVLLWEPNQWTHRTSWVPGEKLNLAVGNGEALVAYNSKTGWVCDATREKPTYQELPRFWEGALRQILFLGHVLVANADAGIFIGELVLDHSFHVQQVRKVNAAAALLATVEYNSMLVILAEGLKTIELLTLQHTKSSLQKQNGNPLTNQGLVCAGGYSKSNGCIASNGFGTINNYSAVEVRVQPLSSGCYEELPESMSLPKLKEFIKKHYVLPDKYRPIAYRFALQLPVSPKAFLELQRKGRHPCTDILDKNYPIQNRQLAAAMHDMMSLLAHWQPVMGESDLVPPIVFPFVCLLGNDPFLCFQVLYRLFSGPLAFLFTEYPLANTALLQNMWQIFKEEDAELAHHLQSKGISFTRLVWTLLGSFFTNFAREGFLAAADVVFLRADQPQIVIFLCLGYLIFNRKRLLSADNQESACSLCEEEHTLHVGKYLKLFDKLHRTYAGKIRYRLKTSPISSCYEPLEVPVQAVKMQENKRKIIVQELQKHQEAEAHRQRMLEQIETMAVKARREAERQAMQQQAYELHCQNQQNYNVHTNPVDRNCRIERLQSLINELTVALEQEQKGRELLRQYVPTVGALSAKSDQQIDQLEQKLLRLVGEVRPGGSMGGLISQPVIHRKSERVEGLRGAVGAKLASELWQLDELQRGKQAIRWQNGILASLHH